MAIARELFPKPDQATAKPEAPPKKRVGDRDPFGHIAFAKGVGPNREEYPKREYVEEDKGFEAEVNFARAGKPNQPDSTERTPGRAGGGRNIVPEGSRGSRTEKPPVPFREGQRPGREGEEQRPDEVARLREQLTRAEDAYAQAYAVAKSRMGLIRRTLGIENVEKDPAVRQAREAYVAAREAFNNLNVNRLQEKLRSGQINEAQFNQEAQRLLEDIFVKHDLNLQNKKMQFRQAEDLRRGTFAGRVEAWWNRAVNAYRKLPFLAKLGLSAGLVAFGGVLAVPGIVAMRIAGGAASAKGTQELLQSIADRWRQRAGGLRAGQRMLGFEQMSLEQRASALQDLINNYHGDMNQRFVRRERGDIMRRHIGIFTGMVVGSGVLSGYIRDVIGDWWTGGKGGVVTPEGPVKGVLGTEAIETRPHGHVINEDENIWKVTRDIYMENPDGYQYDPSDPKIERLFQSFKRQGILGRLGIDADSFGDLPDEDKIKIWAENRTANSVDKLAQIQEGRIRDLVHAGDTVTVNPDGLIVFNEASGIRAGYLDDVRARGGTRGAVDTSQFDRQIEAARARGAAAETWRQSETARLGAEAHALNGQAIAGITDANAGLWNKWLEGLGGFRLDTPAVQIEEVIGRHSPGVIGDAPMIPTPDELAQTGKAISFTQETFEKFPPLNGRETMQAYLERMSRTNFNLFKALSIINKL